MSYQLFETKSVVESNCTLVDLKFVKSELPSSMLFNSYYLLSEFGLLILFSNFLIFLSVVMVTFYSLFKRLRLKFKGMFDARLVSFT